MGHARVLSKLESHDQIEELANKVVSENLSVRDLEKLTESTDFVRSAPVAKTKKSKDRLRISFLFVSFQVKLLASFLHL